MSHVADLHLVRIQAFRLRVSGGWPAAARARLGMGGMAIPVPGLAKLPE